VTVERDRRSPPGGSSDPEAPRRDGPPADDLSAETLSGADLSGENLSGDVPDDDPSADRVAIEDFLDDPTRDLSAWRRLWRRDVPFPIRSHRGLLGRVLVAFKKLFRPLVSVPQNDLWERQRVFNVILLEHLQALARRRHEDRVSHLEGFLDRGIKEVMAHNDALFARVDQKVDRRSREVRDLAASLGAALAVLEGARPEAGAGSEVGEESAVETLARAREEHAYLELEQRHRGTESEIRERLERYLPYLESAAASTQRPVLDLGCGRGEALRLLSEHGLAARGVDGSVRMVERCREQGLDAETGDLFEALAGQSGGSLGGIVSFHVIEHLPAPELDRLVRLAHRALAPGGVLILETPNPLSLVAGSRNFWLDPTHRRPVHPESLRLLYELAGFSSVEVLELRPFPESERLPQIDLTDLPRDLHPLADQINRLRDRLDDLLYGAQDFAVIGHA
jgi:SAM-dependent methyltransferase